MRPFNRSELTSLIASHAEPCVSICMPTHGRPPESQQDPIRYANLVREARTALERKYGVRDERVGAIVDQLSGIASGDVEGLSPKSFWNHQKRGLAVFASPGFFAWYRVPAPLRDVTVVADSFHVKPLLPLLYDDVRFQVLALTRNDVRLYEGSRDEVVELPMDGIPRTLLEAVGTEFDDQHQGSKPHGSRPGTMASGSAGGAGSGPQFHGYGKADKSQEVDLEKFFRAVDRALLEREGNGGLPLILAGIDHYHPLFRSVSHNPHLLPDGIVHDPKTLSPTELHEAAWRIFEPLRGKRVATAVDEYGAASARGLAVSEPDLIASAALAGRVKRLLVEERRRLWGRVNRKTGEVALGGAQGNPDDVDVFDDLAELTLGQGGDIAIVPKDRMPVSTGVAAVLRF